MLKFWRLIGVGIVCHAASLSAQTVSNSSRAFVDVTLGPDWDDAYHESFRVPGAAWESGLAFGFDWGRSGVEIDVGVPQWHVKNRGPQRFQYVGSTSAYLEQFHFYESSSTERRRSIDVTVLHRTNVPVNRHATFAWLVGGGFVFRPDQFAIVTKEVLPGGQLKEVNTDERTSFSNYLAATGGFDVDFMVTPHVSVVPRLRVTAFPSIFDDSGHAPRVLTARPEVAVRWVF